MIDKSNVVNFSVTCFLFYLLTNGFMALGESNLDEYHLEESHDLELKPMFIVNNDDQFNKGSLELKEFYDKYDSLCGYSMKKYDSLLKTINNYVQRYVNLFLIVSGTFDQEGRDPDELITVDIEITISAEDLAYLQNVSKMSEKKTVLKDLSRLDAILSKIVRRRERSYFESALRFSISILYYLGLLIHRVFLLSNFYHYIPFLTILLVTWFIHRFYSRKSFYFYLAIMINGMMFWDSLKLYRRKIKDAEIEVERLKLQEMPPECDPANSKWYHSVMSIFSKDRCLEYFKNVNRNPVDEVSFFQSIIDTYSFYTFENLFRIIGASIRSFTEQILGLWPTYMQWFVALPLVSFIIILLVFSIIILFGKRLKLSWFGASVEVGHSSAIKETWIISKTGRRLIAGYRPLGILAKSRFFRRSKLDLAKDRKPNLKASKLECAIECKENNDVQPSTASDPEIEAKKQD